MKKEKQPDHDEESYEQKKTQQSERRRSSQLKAPGAGEKKLEGPNRPST